MIRFCDREVCCVEYESINRRELLDYFFHGNMDETVCVMDTNGRYRGRIVYYTLIRCEDVYQAVLEDSVTLDKEIWKNARNFFKNYESSYGEHVLLPVVDKEGRLVCFAYEDPDANRELRMLRELTETPDALQFSDIYPQYQCVKLYEFNELAFYFAEYLKSHDIAVRVVGEMWREFFTGTECQIPDYECLTVYAEGIEGRKRNHAENLKKSVSVEFECIDCIYETNLKKGYIRNAEGDCAALLKRLAGREIIILGIYRRAQEAYNFFVKNGLDICCFVDINREAQTQRLFGKRVISRIEAINSYKDPAFISCYSENSAWGMGETDYYEYMGYKRNESFFSLRDYTKIWEENLIHALKSTAVVLAGDALLCSRLSDYLQKQSVQVIGYLSTPRQEYENMKKMREISACDVTKDMMCLCVTPYFFNSEFRKEGKQAKDLKEYLKENGIDNFSFYFSDYKPYIKIEEKYDVKDSGYQIKPGKIVLGSIESCSGNMFFRGLLDGHPNIIMTSYGFVNSNLFWLCVCLSTAESADILPLFWKLCGKENTGIFNPVLFNEKMEQLLSYKSGFTSQELFVMIHLAYMYMCGREISEEAMKEMVIYWEPHNVDRDIVENYAQWLGTEETPCIILNLVRNICMRNGSALKGFFKKGWEYSELETFLCAVSYPSIEKVTYPYCERMVIRFEDLKCRPKEILQEVCQKWGIKWSDMLMKTTDNGKTSLYDNGERQISDFDLEPVYNCYEEYFSEFDRLRIMIACAPWQKKYGYPYVELSEFSRRELQEMFSKKFRFEDMIEHNGSRLLFDIKVMEIIRNQLQKVRVLENDKIL